MIKTREQIMSEVRKNGYCKHGDGLVTEIITLVDDDGYDYKVVDTYHDQGYECYCGAPLNGPDAICHHCD